MLIKLKKIKAFTLAEILVAVSVVGVLAAIIIPVVGNLAPDENKIKFKTAHHTLEVAVDSIINSADAYPATSSTAVSVGGFMYQRGFNYTTATSNGMVNKFCYFLSNALNTIGTTSCPARTASGSYGTFTTSDGEYWRIYNAIADSANDGITSATTNANAATFEFPMDSTVFATKVIVDVNGTTKGPDNTISSCSTDVNASTYGLTRCSWYSASACTKAPDVYIFGVRYDGKLQVGSTDSADFCAQKILLDPLNNKKF